MVQITSLIFLASLIVAGVSTPSKRTVPQVLTDIAAISSQTTTLDNAIRAFNNPPPGTLAQALAIHTDATNLNSQINTATRDVINTGPVSVADGRTVLDRVEAIEPTIIDALTVIITKEAAFQSLAISGIPALVLSDLRTLNTSTGAFENALIAAAPASLVAEGRQVQSRITAAFNAAIAAYA